MQEAKSKLYFSFGAKGAILLGFVAAIFLLAGGAFLNKMVHFIQTIQEDQILGFGAVAVGTYLCGMFPLLFLMLWAVLTGRFRDVEAPKYRMLELDEEIEREGRHARVAG